MARYVDIMQLVINIFIVYIIIWFYDVTVKITAFAIIDVIFMTFHVIIIGFVTIPLLAHNFVRRMLFY